MKTLIKSIKAITFIFLVFAISSCHDELIEQQDVSNTNQEFSKKPIKYCGSFVAGGYTGDNLLVSGPKGNSSSNSFTIQWAPGCNNPTNCDEVFNLTVTGEDSNKDYEPRYSVQISVSKKRGEITSFQIWMRDEFENLFATDNIPFDTAEDPVFDPPEAFTIEINQTVMLYRYTGKGQKKRESVGYISIGTLEYVLKNPDCDCWNPCQ